MRKSYQGLKTIENQNSNLKMKNRIHREQTHLRFHKLPIQREQKKFHALGTPKLDTCIMELKTRIDYFSISKIRDYDESKNESAEKTTNKSFHSFFG